MTKKLGNLFIDGEKVIEDETGAHTITSNGVTVNTNIKKYGDSSLYFNDLNDLTMPATSGLQFNTEDFTLDFWIYFIAGENSNSHLIEQNDTINRWQFWRDGSVWRFYTSGIDFEISDLISNGVWYHIALVRHNGIFRIYRDGNLLKEVTSEIITPIPTFLGTLYIGSYKSSGQYLNGHLDNIRITKGEALWAEEFNLDDSSLFYSDPTPASVIYNTKQTKIRGKAAEGFIRPTIAEFFTSKDFEEILKTPPPTVIGQIYEGGYYMGTLGDYYLVCSPGATAQTTRAIKPVNTATPGSQSFSDGYANTQAMLAAGSAPAAEWCTSLDIGGFSDWYIAAYSELSLMRANYVALEAVGAGTFFGGGGASGHQWSSTEEDSLHNYYMKFAEGTWHDVIKTGIIWIRPIRRVAI